MDSTLRALGEILLKAVPTFLLVVLLHFYLKRVFFQPMEKVLHARYLETVGARKLAQQSMEHAAARTAHYEDALRAARSEVYQAEAHIYKQVQESSAAQIAAARQAADAALNAARAQIAQEAEEAKAGLRSASDALAGRIADSLLRGTAA